MIPAVTRAHMTYIDSPVAITVVLHLIFGIQDSREHGIIINAIKTTKHLRTIVTRHFFRAKSTMYPTNTLMPIVRIVVPPYKFDILVEFENKMFTQSIFG